MKTTTTIQTTSLALFLALTTGCATVRQTPVHAIARAAAPAVPGAVHAREFPLDLAHAPAREAFPLAAVAPERMVAELRMSGLFVDVRPLEDPKELILAEHELLIEGPLQIEVGKVDLSQRLVPDPAAYEAIPPVALRNTYAGHDGLGGEPVKWTVERRVQVTAQGGATARQIAESAKEAAWNNWDAYFVAALHESEVLAQKAQALSAARGTREQAMARIEYLRGRQQELSQLASDQDKRVYELQGKLRDLEMGQMIGNGMEQTLNQLNGVSRNPLAGFNELNSFTSNIARQTNFEERDRVQREIGEAQQLTMKYEALAERVGSMIEPISESLYSLAAN